MIVRLRPPTQISLTKDGKMSWVSQLNKKRNNPSIFNYQAFDNVKLRPLVSKVIQLGMENKLLKEEMTSWCFG